MKLLLCTLFVTAVLAGPARCQPTDNIPELAAKLGLTTLLDLVTRAGLADVLSGPGPFTVVAPTNDAFALMPEDLLAFLLSNNTALQEVLKYHVAPQRLSGDIESDRLVTTLQGMTARVNNYDFPDYKLTTVNGAPIIIGDQEATNGFIQVAAGFMWPPVGNAVDLVLSLPDRFSTLATALTIAELVPTLQGDGPFTIFAPTNDAFAKIDDLDRILENKELLTSILLYHVVGSTAYSVGLSNEQEVPTLQGNSVTVRINDNIFINNAKVTNNDWSVTNGVIHIIDTVLLPPTY